MQVHRRTEITVETSEVVVLRRAQIYRGWCSECGQEVDMVGMTDAERLWKKPGTNKNPVQNHDWHVRACGETALVCMQSLLKSL